MISATDAGVEPVVPAQEINKRMSTQLAILFIIF